MNWLERYVEGVKRFLPRKKREDIGAEILSVLADKLEAEEDKRGRKLNDREMKEWVGSLDHPMALAAGYQERRELVSPELFPLYLFTLKIAIGIVFALKVFGTGFYILGAVDFNFWQIFQRLFNGLLESGLLAFASITVVFHFLGRHISARKFFDNWKVSDLPKSGAKWVTVPVGETVFEIVFYVFSLGVLQTIVMGKWDQWWDSPISANPALYDLIGWVQAVIVLFLVHRLWLVIRPNWDTAKLTANILITGFGLWVLTMFMNIEPFLYFDPAFVTDHPGIDRGGWLNRGISITLFVIAAVYLYEIARDFYRIYKLNR